MLYTRVSGVGHDLVAHVVPSSEVRKSMMQGDNDEWMTAGEAAAYLEVDRRRIPKFIADGQLHPHQRTRDKRMKWFRKSEVEDFRQKMDETKKLTRAA